MTDTIPAAARQELSDRFVVAGAAGTQPGPFDYRLAIPKDFRPRRLRETAEPGEPFTVLAAYGDTEREIRVLVTILPREMDAGDFLEFAAGAAGRTVVQRRDWLQDGLANAELFEEYVVEGHPWLRRSRAVKDGPRLFRIQASARVEAYEQRAEELALSLLSFRLIHPERVATAETLREIRLHAPAGYFRCPDSWRLEIPADASHYELDNGQQTGTIFVIGTAPDATIGAPLDAFRSWLHGRGLRLGGAALMPGPPLAGFETTLQYAPAAIRNGVEVRVAAHVLLSPTAVAVVGLLGPTRSANEWAWSVNKRALEIVRSSLTFPTGAEARTQNAK